MSIRSRSTDDSYANAVRRDLESLKATAVEASRVDNVDPTIKPEGAEAAAAYDQLALHEQAAASLGVHPDSLRPIGFLNSGTLRNAPPLPSFLSATFFTDTFIFLQATTRR